MITILLLVGCGAALLLLVAVIVAGVLVAQAGGRHGVSSARQEWIERRSNEDERGW